MTVPFGTYLEPWEPDEEILASTLNKRERKYSGGFLHDFIGTNTASPIISITSVGELYGDPSAVWGFMMYKAVAGAGLINDALSISDGTLSFVTAPDFTFYGEPKKYGFTAYGYANGFPESLSIIDGAPVVNIGTIDQQYGDPDADYGLMQYGYENGLMTDSVTTGDSTLSISATSTTPNIYGTGKKYGFCVWQP